MSNPDPTYDEILETIIRGTVKAAVYWALTGDEPGGSTPHELVDNTIRMHGAENIVAKSVRAAMACHNEIISVTSTKVVTDHDLH